MAGDGKANVLRGHLGADELAGRGGADRFLYAYTNDSTPRRPITSSISAGPRATRST